MTEAVRLAYRDHDRTPLLYLIKDQAARHEDLEIDILHVPGGKDYRGGFLEGKFELICEHLRFLFPARLEGHPVRCIAASATHGVDCLVGARRVASVEELKGKTAAVRDNESSGLTLKYWLKSLGLTDHVRVAIHADKDVGRWQQWRKVASGDADVALCSPLYLTAPLDAGLHVLEIPPLPVIGPLFFATRGPVIEARNDSLRRFMRALYRAMDIFHNDPTEALAVMARGPADLMGLRDERAIHQQYDVLRAGMARRPIPLIESIQNTFQMVQEAYDVAALNPLTLWDLRYVMELDEQRFMEGLAASRGP